LPLFERDLQSLNSELRQDTLPKVQLAAYGLPTELFICTEKGRPSMNEKSVLAAIFMVTSGKVFGQSSHQV